MKSFIRTVLTCLLACIAFSVVQAEVPGEFATGACGRRFPIAPRGTACHRALAQHSPVPD